MILGQKARLGHRSCSGLGRMPLRVMAMPWLEACVWVDMSFASSKCVLSLHPRALAANLNASVSYAPRSRLWRRDRRAVTAHGAARVRTAPRTTTYGAGSCVELGFKVGLACCAWRWRRRGGAAWAGRRCATTRGATYCRRGTNGRDTGPAHNETAAARSVACQE